MTRKHIVDINPTISTITLNVNGLNTLTKRQISGWMGGAGEAQLYAVHKKPTLLRLR